MKYEHLQNYPYRYTCGGIGFLDLRIFQDKEAHKMLCSLGGTRNPVTDCRSVYRQLLRNPCRRKFAVTYRIGSIRLARGNIYGGSKYAVTKKVV